MKSIEWNLQDTLICPFCACFNLHQRSASVGFRGNQDEPLSMVADTNVRGTTVRQGRIPGRRDAILISFTCEFCSAIPRLVIIQDGGYTRVMWEAGFERDPAVSK